MTTCYQCHFCERTFHFKDLFENHEPVCQFFYKSSREKTREDEKIENLPSLHDMYKLVQYMYSEIQRQRVKIEQLERVTKRRLRGMDLFAGLPDPILAFRPWVNSLEVRQEHLLRAFQEDVFEGIRICIEDSIKRDGVQKIPLRSFIEKPAVLWIYKTVSIDGVDTKKWILCDSTDILFLVEHLMGEFMRVYCDWEDANQEWISKSMENKELHINYLCKITGSMVYHKDRKRAELRNWLCKIVKEK